MKLQNSARRGLILLSLVVGFAMRLYHLGEESLWYDETVSVFLSRQPIPDLIAHTARDIHPPGYYLMLHLWQQATGPLLGRGLEFLYAWPSLWWGMLLLPLIYTLSRKLFDHRIALVALWLAAVHPYHLWYNQEARMYTVGAALGLLCFWAVIKVQEPVHSQAPAGAEPLSPESRSHLAWLMVYIVAAAGGLYTLYYFAFLLITLNIIVLLRYLLSQHTTGGQLLAWAAAQFAVVLLWLPWMPALWRQITDPPVPAWRTAVEPLTVLRESLAALVVGQSPPLENAWIWVSLAGVILSAALFDYANKRRRDGLSLVLIYIFGPLILIYMLSVWVTPLYHIRYFFIYGAPVPLLLALGLDRIGRRWWLFAASLAALLLISIWSATEFWTNDRYRTDDHRTAVAELAAAWRPGDAILVNAGWIYPILETYWPHQPLLPSGAIPAPLMRRVRLIDYAQNNSDLSGQAPTLITTGSIDGSPSLGWGLPESDFYAMPQSQAETALTQLAHAHPRIWHYRLYDTVSDPPGVLRKKLEEMGDLRLDHAYPGRDFLRVQLYETTEAEQTATCPATGGAIDFGNALRLYSTGTAEAAIAGRFVYVTLCWEARGAIASYPDGLRTSLRLYPSGAIGETLVAQADTAPLLATTAWQPGRRYRQPLALPLPANLSPGQYALALVVYNGRDGAALSISNPNAIYGQIWPLSEVIIHPLQ